MDEIKGNTRLKGYQILESYTLNFLKKFTDLSNKEIANLHEIGSSTVTNVLNGRYKWKI